MVRGDDDLPGGLNVDEERYYVTTRMGDGRRSEPGEIAPLLSTHHTFLSSVVFHKIEFDIHKEPGNLIIPVIAQLRSLSDIKFDRCPISTEAWAVIGVTLSQLSLLSRIAIIHPRSPVSDYTSLMAVMMALTAITHLTSIELDLSNFDDLSRRQKESLYMALERALSGRKSLVHLRLAIFGFYMDDVTIGGLLGALCSSSPIETLNIAYTELMMHSDVVGTAEAALRNQDPILSQIRKWHSFWRYLNSAVCKLTSLNLGYNHINPTGWRKLVNGLRFNTSLRYLAVNHNPINSAGIPALTQLLIEHRTGSLDVVHYSLRKCIWNHDWDGMLDISSLRSIESVLCGDPPLTLIRSRVNHKLRALDIDLPELIRETDEATDATTKALLFNIQLSLVYNSRSDTLKRKLLGRFFPVIVQEVVSTTNFHFVEKVLELAGGNWISGGRIDGITSYKNDDFTDILQVSTFMSMTHTVLTTCTRIEGVNSSTPFIISLIGRSSV